MAKTAGRDVVIKIGGTAVAGARTKSITINGTPIDDSDADDDAPVSMIEDVFSEETMEITLSGLEDGVVLRDLAFATTPASRHISNLTFVFAGTPVDEISGEFIMTSYTKTGDYREATTFDATFVRNGVHTFTQGT